MNIKKEKEQLSRKSTVIFNVPSLHYGVNQKPEVPHHLGHNFSIMTDHLHFLKI